MVMIMKKKFYLFEFNTLVLNGLALLLLIIGFGGFVLTLNSGLHLDFDFDKEYKLFIVLLAPYFVLHEIVHYIGFIINGANPKKLCFGVHLEKGVLCTSCKQRVSKKCVLWSLMYPFLFIGVFTLILGFIFNSIILVLLSITNMAGAAGDLAMFFSLLKIKDFEYYEYDNPIGFALVSSHDLSKEKMFGLKFVEVRDNVECHVDKLVTVSKKSITYIVIWAILCALYLIF